MITKKLFCLLLIFFLLIQGRANTFTVTSNADAGNGSLRGALLLSSQNGSSFKDTILFNLPDLSPGGRTISISSLLIVSNNIVIDGSSQPGPKFGVSDAKVIIRSVISGSCQTGFFIQGVNTIEIYGLWMKDFQTAATCKSAAIFLHEVTGIQIGAPSKGNLFTNNSIFTIEHDARDLFDLSSIHNVTIQSNIFEIDTTGNQSTGSVRIHLGRAFDVLFGGDTEEKGNYVGNGYVSLTAQSFNNTRFYHFSHNKLGLNYSKTARVGSAWLSIGGGIQSGSYMKAEIRITDNECSSSQNNNAVFNIDYFTTDLIIENNQIGLFNNSTSKGVNGIYILLCEKNNNLVVRNNVIKGFSGFGIGTYRIKDITITNNSIYCNKKGIFHQTLVLPIPPPEINILNRTGTYINGTATPGSIVEVFSTNTCYNMCLNGETLLGTVVADAGGNWQLNATNSGNISATATSPAGFTSEFNKIDVDLSGAKLKNATCGLNNGSISGIQLLNVGTWHWEDGSGNIISSDTNLVNVSAGFYKLVVPGSNVACRSLDTVFEIKTYPRPAFSANPFVTTDACNLTTGKIQFMDFRPASAGIIWLNQNLVPFITGIDTIQNLSPGTYFCKLYLLEDTACNIISSPIVIDSKPGPSIDYSTTQITHASCNNTNGSITNISFTNLTGSPSLVWTDIQNNIVATTADLLNAPAGKYRLKLKDGSGCDTIMTPYFTINNLGTITIDQNNQTIIPSKCSANTGSITNIIVSGGDSYEWIETGSNSIIGNTIDVFNLGVGNYKLTVRNSFGCVKDAAVVIIPQTTFISVNVIGWDSKAADCSQPNGEIMIHSFNKDSTLYSFYWVNNTTQQTIGTGTTLTNIDAGDYFLFAIDSNGCEKQIFNASIIAFPMPGFDYTKMNIVHDKCAMGTGSVSQLKVNDLRGNADYTWFNDNNQPVGNAADIQNLYQGSYRLQVTDGTQCTVISQPIVILNTTEVLNSPQYDNQFLLRNTTAQMKVKNPQQGAYQLFDEFSSITPLQENATGIFTTPLVTNDKIYYVRLIIGNCSSNIIAVNIKVVDKITVYVPTAFSPNGDGNNDLLKAVAYGPVTLEYFTVYNRWGQVVFTTKNFNQGWDGKLKGKILDPGVFVWMVKAKDEFSGQWIEQKGTTMIIR